MFAETNKAESGSLAIMKKIGERGIQAKDYVLGTSIVAAIVKSSIITDWHIVITPILDPHDWRQK
ncbi:MAG: hypothetical protein K2X63_02115 [Burkholderiaceae bacterium]|nr:hypothetical protein [Burkholderiaceae bacterium]